MKAEVKAIAYHLPEQRLTNEDLAQAFGDWDAAKILAKTGIKERRVVAANECASDLAVVAAQKLFAAGVCAPSDVDFLLLCTQSPDYLLPATACTLQGRLRLSTKCGALDFNQGCSGFVYGLALAKGLIETGIAHNVLLLTAETYSRFLHPRDRSTRTIFGDAAAATLISGEESEAELLGPFILGTDGRGAKELIVPVGGARHRPTSETSVAKESEGGNWRSQENLFMNGPEIFNFTLQAVPGLVQQLLQKAGRSLDEVDRFVFHQANRFMLDRLRAKMRIPPEKFSLHLETCGNTVSSTIPIALHADQAAGRIAPGQNVMLVGFGVGYSWAACMMRGMPGMTVPGVSLPTI